MPIVNDIEVPITREELPAGKFLCEYCTAKCCRYYAFPITKPKTWKDFDYIRWFLLHGKAGIFVDDGDWYIQVYADCQHLLPDNRCGIYETRPQVCREYTTDNCEYDVDSGHEMIFDTPEQIDEYAEAILPPKKRAPWVQVRSKELALPLVVQ